MGRGTSVRVYLLLRMPVLVCALEVVCAWERVWLCALRVYVCMCACALVLCVSMCAYLPVCMRVCVRVHV